MSIYQEVENIIILTCAVSPEHFKAIKNDNKIHTSSRRYDKIISFETTKVTKPVINFL